MAPEEFTTWQKATQFFGFTPTALTTHYEQQRAIKDNQMAITGRRNYLMDRLFMSYKNGDTKEYNHVVKLMTAFSLAQPRHAFTAEGIKRAAVIRRQNDMRFGTTNLHMYFGY